MESNDRQTKFAALFVGVILSMLISGALVIATAKAGISPGVSPLVVLMGWVCFAGVMRGKLKPFLAMLQVTGSGGAAVSAGLIFTAPILQITAGMMGQPVPEVDVATMTLASLAGSLMGWGFVGLAAKRFLSDPRLPAPEAVACDQLIQTAVLDPGARPPLLKSLVPALSIGFALGWMTFFRWIEKIAMNARIPMPGWSAEYAIKLPVPVSPLYLGIGALLTFPTAVLVCGGGLVNAITNSIAANNGLSDETYRWVGGAAMVVAVVYSLIHYVFEGTKPCEEDAGNAQASDDSLLDLTMRMRSALFSAICLGAALLVFILYREGLPIRQVVGLGVVSVILVSLLSGLGGLLSLQVGASASPVSGTVFMAMLVLSVASIGLGQSGFVAIAALQPVLVATCVAIAAANDSSQDYKTVQLNGYPVSSAFAGQLAGCLAGAITVPVSLWVAHTAFELGSEQLPCPQAKFFGTVLSSLFDPSKGVPWATVGVGLALGCVAVAIEIVGRRKGVVLSSLAFAVGIYLPAEMGIGILLGNLARVVATGSFRRASHRGILAAAGLIAGDAFLSLLTGVFIVFQFDLAFLQANQPWPAGYGVVALGIAVVFLAYAYSDSKREKYGDLRE